MRPTDIIYDIVVRKNFSSIGVYELNLELIQIVSVMKRYENALWSILMDREPKINALRNIFRKNGNQALLTL